MSSEPSKLDERQVLQNVHDEDRQTLRVDATVFLDGTGPLGDNVSIVGEDGEKLVINPDGSINVNTVITGAGDATAENQEITNDLLVNILTELSEKTQPNDVQIISNLDAIKDSVTSIIDNDSIIELQTIQDSSNIILSQIELNTQGLATSLKQDDIISELQNINNSQLILNIKEQILRAVDREQSIIYADFGTKDQRITEVNYTASSVGGSVAKKTIIYSLVGNKYRRDSIDWSIV